jgi:hypothetical protein
MFRLCDGAAARRDRHLTPQNAREYQQSESEKQAGVSPEPAPLQREGMLFIRHFLVHRNFVDSDGFVDSLDFDRFQANGFD